MGVAQMNDNNEDDSSSLNSSEKQRIWNDVFFPEVDDDPEIYVAWIKTSTMHDYTDVDISSSKSSDDEESVKSTATASTTNLNETIIDNIDNLNINVDSANDNDENQDRDNDGEVGAVSMPTTLQDISGKEYWIGDTSATTHLTNCNDGMINVRKAKNGENVVMGNGTAAMAQTVGDLLGTICNKDGKDMNKLRLSEVTYAKNSKFNLFSLSAMIKKGWKLVGDNNKLELVNNNQKITFDIKIHTPKGLLFCLHIKRNRNEEAANIGLTEENKVKSFIELALNANKMDANKVHEVFGHMGEQATKKVCAHLGMNMKTVAFKHTCESYVMGKEGKKMYPKLVKRF